MNRFSLSSRLLPWRHGQKMVTYAQCLIAPERIDSFAPRTQILRIAVSKVAFW